MDAWLGRHVPARWVPWLQTAIYVVMAAAIFLAWRDEAELFFYAR